MADAKVRLRLEIAELRDKLTEAEGLNGFIRNGPTSPFAKRLAAVCAEEIAALRTQLTDLEGRALAEEGQ